MTTGYEYARKTPNGVIEWAETENFWSSPGGRVAEQEAYLTNVDLLGLVVDPPNMQLQFYRRLKTVEYGEPELIVDPPIEPDPEPEEMVIDLDEPEDELDSGPVES